MCARRSGRMGVGVNFIWDIALRAQAQGKEERELFFCQAREYSPFYEQAFSCLNETQVPEGRIELNLFARFAGIFQDLLAWEEEEPSIFGEYLTDAVLHALLYTDLRRGLSGRDIYIRKIRQELEQGVFWKEAAEVFREMPIESRNRLAALTLVQMQTGSSLMLFRRGIKVLFPEAILYQIKEDRKKILLYLVGGKTRQREENLRFAQDMFLPINYELRVFWQYHFGIIGVDDAMRLDEIAIY